MVANCHESRAAGEVSLSELVAASVTRRKKSVAGASGKRFLRILELRHASSRFEELLKAPRIDAIRLVDRFVNVHNQIGRWITTLEHDTDTVPGRVPSFFVQKQVHSEGGTCK